MATKTLLKNWIAFNQKNNLKSELKNKMRGQAQLEGQAHETRGSLNLTPRSCQADQFYDKFKESSVAINK